MKIAQTPSSSFGQVAQSPVAAGRGAQQLEASTDPKDRQAAAELARMLGKQPGIGQ